MVPRSGKENAEENVFRVTEVGGRHHWENTKAFAIGLGLGPMVG